MNSLVMSSLWRKHQHNFPKYVSIQLIPVITDLLNESFLVVSFKEMKSAELCTGLFPLQFAERYRMTLLLPHVRYRSSADCADSINSLEEYDSTTKQMTCEISEIKQ